MDIDERQMERENHAKDLQHEMLMVESEEYFCQWTTEHFDLKDCIDFVDVIDILNTHLAEYGWQLDDLVNYWKEM